MLLLLAPIACGDDKSEVTSDDGLATSGTSSPTTTSGTETGTETDDGATVTSEGTTPTTGSPTSVGETTATGTTATDSTATETTATTATEGTTTDATTGMTGSTGSTGTSDTGGETGLVPADCTGDAPHVLLMTTLGDMVVKLDAVNAPVTVANFIDYVESGFYNGTIFHRVIDNFVIQGGGFEPGLQQKPTNAPIALEISPELRHIDGAIAMARTNDPNSATSQFYICDGPQGLLDDQYAVFGVLVDGFDVLDAIASVPVHDVGQFGDMPVEDVIVTMAYCVAGI